MERVLIFDCDSQIPVGIELLLRAHSYDVLWATDRHSLSEIIDLQAVDLVIAGVGTNVLEQLDVYVWVRHVADIPVLAVSSSRSEDDTVRVLDAGVDDVLTQPFGQEELLARVRALLRR